MSFRRSFRLVTAFAVALVGTVLVDPAHAANPGCGDILTQNTTLTADVGPCPLSGLILDADNITLNLNGHRVFGVPGPQGGSGNPNTNPLQVVGIFFDNVQSSKVTNGTVSGFNSGVYIEGNQEGDDGNNEVSRMRISDNVGIVNGPARGIFGEGIQIYGSNGNRILNNQVIRNGTFSGIDVFVSNDTLVDRNVVQNNNIPQRNASGVISIMQSIGIRVIWLPDFDQVTPRDSVGIISINNVVTNNQVTGNGLDGIQVSRFSRLTTLRGNQANKNGFVIPGQSPRHGIAVFGSTATIEGNAAYGNGGHGIAVMETTFQTPRPLEGKSNVIRNNRTGQNDAAPHATVFFDLFDQHTTPPCDANTWTGNTFVTRNQTCIN